MFNKKGQSVAEMALFGSLILLAFGTLLSYIQSQNDQEYATMAAFRKALYHACTYSSNDGAEGAGASIQYTVMDHRRNVDVYNRKTTSQMASGGGSVYWAVPEVKEDVDPPSRIMYEINGQLFDFNYRDFVPQDTEDADGDEKDEYTFEPGNIDSTSSLTVRDSLTKREDTAGITNIRNYNVNETVTVTIPYEVKDEHTEAVTSSGTLLSTSQNLSESGGHSWRTNF
ncbi:MAG: hypothetical protein FJZ09_06660 [Candidatus Omnitrophica bacterium]|nr:hypothetical protein [Candidatus Omnitrophota bacterium]